MTHEPTVYYNNCTCNSCNNWRSIHMQTAKTTNASSSGLQQASAGVTFKAAYSLCVSILAVCMFLILTACTDSTTEYCNSDYCIKEGQTLEQIGIDSRYL